MAKVESKENRNGDVCRDKGRGLPVLGEEDYDKCQWLNREAVDKNVPWNPLVKVRIIKMNRVA